MQPATRTIDTLYNWQCAPLPKPPEKVRPATEDDMHENNVRKVGLRFYVLWANGKWVPHTLNKYTDSPSLISLIKSGNVYVDAPPRIMYKN